jgi:uncharacterized protein DUF5988
MAICAVLIGGPSDLPEKSRVVRDPAIIEGAKIKVPHMGGYEHFECDQPRAGHAGCVCAGPVTFFRWTGRTKIAE